ncbi:MAG: acyl-CoA dehydrogenase [Pseudomonadota bacterium]
MFNPSENDLRFAIHKTIGLETISDLPGHEDVSDDLVDAILSEAAKLASEVIAPTNHQGDVEGAHWHQGGIVTTPTGFKDAFKAMGEGGWCGIGVAEEYGGQGMPNLVSAAVREMWHSANMAFALCHLLTEGQLEALQGCASEEQKQTYIPPMAEGRWTGTMNLTEPQAGTDLAAIRTMATPEADHYRIKGQKIYITYGEHDMAENTIHLVLAKTPGAPDGVKGISVFIVPKFLVNEDGSLGERNDVKCVSIEHKLGIKGSPTAVLAFGEEDGAIGYLVGEEHQGLKIMFQMMNHARFSVGIQGLSISNRAYYQALAYANERKQGTPMGREEGAAIIHHPDVARLLSTMRAEIEAMRGLALYGAMCLDRGHHDATWQARAEYLVPIIKGWLTERSLAITSDGVQVHGGMGFIEETGAAQHYRDAKILTIYEGTTAIQANDLIGRKTGKDKGAIAFALLAEVKDGASPQLLAAVERAEAAIKHLLDGGLNAREAHAVSVPYLMMMGYLLGGWMTERSAKAAEQAMVDGGWDTEFLKLKPQLADVYRGHSLPEVYRFAETIMAGASAVEAIDVMALSA